MQAVSTTVINMNHSLTNLLIDTRISSVDTKEYGLTIEAGRVITLAISGEKGKW